MCFWKHRNIAPIYFTSYGRRYLGTRHISNKKKRNSSLPSLLYSPWPSAMIPPVTGQEVSLERQGIHPSFPRLFFFFTAQLHCASCLSFSIDQQTNLKNSYLAEQNTPLKSKERCFVCSRCLFSLYLENSSGWQFTVKSGMIAME